MSLNLSFGPRLLTKSLPRLPDFVNEFLTQDTSRVMKNPVLAKNDGPFRHEIGVGFHLFIPFSPPC
jgi:hypothetical protein